MYFVHIYNFFLRQRYCFKRFLICFFLHSLKFTYLLTVIFVFLHICLVFFYNCFTLIISYAELTQTKMWLSFSLLYVYTLLRNFVRKTLSLPLFTTKPLPFCRKFTQNIATLCPKISAICIFYRKSAANMPPLCRTVCPFLHQVYRTFPLFYHNFFVFLPKSAAIFFFCRKFTTSQTLFTASLI